MNTSKIIRAVVGGGRYTTTAPIMKEDHGLYLKIEGIDLPSVYEVDFSNSRKDGESVTMVGNSDGVLIPTQFIKTGKDVFAFYYYVGSDYGRTVYTFCIPNKTRPDRTNEQPEPEQQSVIDQAISALNTAVAQTSADVASANASAQSASASASSAAQSASQAAESATNAEASKQAAAQSETNAASSASAAETAAATATQKASQTSSAESAAASAAQTATAKAIEAAQIVEGVEGYAESAAQSASQAQASAQTASTKASEASASASTASAKATEATTAAASANTAKTDAVSAKTAAETAQTAAETAQSAAEDAAESVSASAAQIAVNTSDITDLKENLTDKAPIILETASGSIASFTDGADNMPMKSLVVDIDPVQSGSGDPSPDNVRPISGWTGVTVNRTGKNLLDTSDTTHNAYNIGSIPNILKPNTTYTFSVNGSTTNKFKLYTAKSTAPLSALTPLSRDYFSKSDGAQTFTTPSTMDDLLCLAGSRNGAGNASLADILPQLELGSTATAYEPYNGSTYSVNWQSEAGTVYGGHIDVVSGELVVDRAMVDMGSIVWNYNTTYAFFNSNSILTRKIGVLNVWSDLFKTMAGSWSGTPVQNALWGNGSNTTLYVQTPPLDNVNDFIALVDGHQLMYELAAPIVYHLTPTEVQSILGTNHVWADCGDAEAVYRADTKLYIQRLTQPEEDDMIADANIVSGQYFMVGNTLYKATANIANGGQIIVGTNCIRKSLSEALNEINA